MLWLLLSLQHWTRVGLLGLMLGLRVLRSRLIVLCVVHDGECPLRVLREERCLGGDRNRVRMDLHAMLELKRTRQSLASGVSSGPM